MTTSILTVINRSRRPRSLGAYMRREWLTTALTIFLIVVVVGALLAPWIAPYNPNQQDLANALQGPTPQHLLGTDDLGRDVLSRLMFGAQVSLRASLQSVAVALLIAVPLGLAAGFIGGFVDNVIMRILDVLLALPALVFVIALSTAMGGGLNETMLALSLAFVPMLARITRAETLAVRNETFVEASRAIGTPTGRILWTRILRNILPALQVQTTITMCLAVGAEASLSFIGLGAQPPQASWGSILRRSFDFIFANPIGVVWPALVITLTAWAFNALGDAQADRANAFRSGVRRGFRAITADERPTALPRRTAPKAERAADEAPILQVDDLTVGVETPDGPITLVEGITFDVARGRVLGVVGESGSGKSVTSLTLTRLFTAGAVTRGSVLLDGEDLIAMNDEEVRARRGRDISMVFQTPSVSLNPAMRIIDQIIEVLRLHKALTPKQATVRAAELLEQVGIPAARAHAYPHQLSGGMCQRVMIAVGIACAPQVLIADEPTSALDVTVQAEILDLLRRLTTDGMSLVIVTHDFGVVADICDDVVVMYGGQVVEKGPVADVLGAPRHPYTRALLASMPSAGRKGEKLASIRGQVPLAGTHGVGCRFASRCDFAVAACTERPIPLIPLDDVRSSRCIRVDDLVRDEAFALTRAGTVRETETMRDEGGDR